jgi:hypothetical protein
VTVAALSPFVEYIENGGTLSFGVPFRFNAASDIVVVRRSLAGVVTPLVQGSDYAVVGGATDSGGTVTVAAAGAIGTRLQIRRVTARNQGMDYTTADTFPAQSHEAALDKAMLIAQELDVGITDTRRIIDDLALRTLLVPGGESTLAIPALAVRAGKLFGFDAGGNPVAIVNGGVADPSLRADFAAAGGSALARYDPVGAGAVPETVQTALRRTRWAGQHATLQQTHDAAEIAGDAIEFGAGTFIGPFVMDSRRVDIRGRGMGATIISPATPTGVAVMGDYRLGIWDYVIIRDLALLGTGVKQGVGFRNGPAAYVLGAEYAGRTRLVDLKIGNFEKAIERPYGNIGLDVLGCTIGHNTGPIDYGLWISDNATGLGDGMHAGCIYVGRGHWQSADKAAVYIRGGTTGAGQAVFDSIIFEGNAGWVFYIDGWSSANGQPGGVVRSCWNEINYVAPSVTIGAHTAAPRYAYLKDVDYWRFEDTPIGPMTLINSRVETRDCDLSRLDALTIDAASSLIHHSPRLYSGTAFGLVLSIGAATNAESLTSPWFSMPVPAAEVRHTPTSIGASDAQDVIAFTGSALRNSVPENGDPVRPEGGRTQRLTINDGDTLFPTATFDVGAGAILVVKYLCRLVSGNPATVQINGSSGIGGIATIRESEWRTLTGIIRNGGAAITGLGLFHQTTSGTAVIGIGGYDIRSFTTMQAAITWANAPVIGAPQRPDYAASGYVASRTFDASLATTEEVASVLATLIDDLSIGRLPR